VDFFGEQILDKSAIFYNLEVKVRNHEGATKKKVSAKCSGKKIGATIQRLLR
jgi:hypothetical protein